MAELAHARAELVQLQSTEQTLVKQLLAVRVAIETQKSKISKLTEEQPSLINHLPIELLTRIFGFLLVSSSRDRRRSFKDLPTQRKNLAGVSRFWRDLILNTPIFWSSIRLTGDSKSLMTQLKRSHECVLDITIDDPHGDNPDTLLDTLIPSTNRWRSLTVQLPPASSFLWSNIARKLDQYRFPCLEGVLIDLYSCPYPRFLSPAHCPVLRHLDMRELDVTEGFFTASSPPLTTLSLSICSVRDQSFLSRIPTQSLTSLTITAPDPYRRRIWVLERVTVHFPVLQRLVLDTPNPQLFMDAIVAPKLELFEYGYQSSSIFGTFGSKFHHVSHVISLPKFYDGTFCSVVARGLCQDFSGVRHASLPEVDIATFFERTSPRSHLEPETPADNWESLERLSIICTDKYKGWDADALAKWLTKRQGLGLPSLHIQLEGSPVVRMTIEEFSLRYNQLRDCCVLSFKGIRVFQSLHLPMDGSLLHSCNGGQGQPHFAELAGTIS